MRKEEYIKNRVNKIIDYLIDNKCSTREVAEVLNINRSTINNDLQKHLDLVADINKIEQVKLILKNNKDRKGFNNEYIVEDNVVKIKLENKKGLVLYTIIDKEDLDKVKKLDLRWHLRYAPNTDSYYAQATEYLGATEGKPKYKSHYLQKVIMECDFENDEYVNHKSHNTLDNRKQNLEVLSNKDNTTDRIKPNKNNKSGYRNVSWHSKHNKWAVQLQINGKNKVLKYFDYDKVDEAGEFARQMRIKYYGKE